MLSGPLTVFGAMAANTATSAAINAADTALTIGRTNQAYAVIEEKYIAGFSEGWKKILPNTDPHESLWGNESSKIALNQYSRYSPFLKINHKDAPSLLELLAAKSLAHAMSTATFATVNFAANYKGPLNNPEVPDKDLGPDKLIPKSTTRRKVIKLGMMGLASLANYRVSHTINNREQMLANAVSRISINEKKLEDIYQRGLSDGGQIAQKIKTAENRTSYLKELHGSMDKGVIKPLTPAYYGNDIKWSHLQSLLEGTASTLATWFVGGKVMSGMTLS